MGEQLIRRGFVRCKVFGCMDGVDDVHSLRSNGSGCIPCVRGEPCGERVVSIMSQTGRRRTLSAEAWRRTAPGLMECRGKSHRVPRHISVMVGVLRKRDSLGARLRRHCSNIERLRMNLKGTRGEIVRRAATS